MGKGFTLQNTEGRDLADMFHEAFDRNVSKYLVKKQNMLICVQFRI
jgi:hypothetical protein